MSMTFLLKTQTTDFTLSISAPVFITWHHKQPKSFLEMPESLWQVVEGKRLSEQARILFRGN